MVCRGRNAIYVLGYEGAPLAHRGWGGRIEADAGRTCSCGRGVGPVFGIHCVHCTAVKYFHVGAD